MKAVGVFLLILSAAYAQAGVFNGTTSCQLLGSDFQMLFYGKCNFTNGGNVNGGFTTITFPVVVAPGTAGNEYEAVMNVSINLSEQGEVVRNVFTDVDGSTHQIYDEQFVAEKGWDWQSQNNPIIKRAGSRIEHPKYGTFQW